MRAVHADAIVTGDADVVRDGAVVVGAGAEVIDFGPAGDVIPRHAGLPLERVRGVVLPGLVNAHVHIELSALRGQVPGGAGFVPWVEHLIGLRAEGAPEDDANAIDRAVLELVEFGTAAVGEVTNSLAAVHALARHGLSGCVFHEVFGVELAGLQKRVSDLPRSLAEVVGTWPSAALTYSPSPHTLYTTHREVVRELVVAAGSRGLRVSLHLAEHAAERRFLERGEGPIVKWYGDRLKLPVSALEHPGDSPIAFADRLGALAPHVLAVHLTDARPEEFALVAARGCSVVFCPRSNLYIESRLPPLLLARAAGVWPALGTDSLASNASLDVLAEARALADRFPTVPTRDLLRMATWEGARALGRTDLGRIAKGARPGLLAIESDLQGSTLAADAAAAGSTLVAAAVAGSSLVAAAVAADPCGFVLRNLRAPRRWIARAPA
jgi:cytosine/adenosine deaminase-related metal-dependent hydrolase